MYYVETLIGGDPIGADAFDTLEHAEVFAVMMVNSYKASPRFSARPELWEIELRHDNEVIKRIKGTQV